MRRSVNVGSLQEDDGELQIDVGRGRGPPRTLPFNAFQLWARANRERTGSAGTVNEPELRKLWEAEPRKEAWRKKAVAYADSVEASKTRNSLGNSANATPKSSRGHYKVNTEWENSQVAGLIYSPLGGKYGPDRRRGAPQAARRIALGDWRASEGTLWSDRRLRIPISPLGLSPVRYGTARLSDKAGTGVERCRAAADLPQYLGQRGLHYAGPMNE